MTPEGGTSTNPQEQAPVTGARAPREERSTSNRMNHPLAGADPWTILRVLSANGGVAPDRFLPVAGALAGSIVRLPFTLAERAWVGARRGRARSMPAPVFIVGHWRSGTTHLCNVLGKSPDLGFVSPFATGLPRDFLLLGRMVRPLLRRALPKHRHIDRVPVLDDSPQEDETAMANMGAPSFFNGLYFPRRLEEHMWRGVFLEGAAPSEIRRWERGLRIFVDKLYLEQGKRVVIKNPVYTARIDRLSKLYPEARFIHIHRNPYRVFESMRHFFPALFRQLSLHDPPSTLDVEDLILRVYPALMIKLETDARTLAPGRYAEVRFDDLEARPLEVLERLYGDLELEGFDRARPRFETYLESVAGYRKNAFPMPAASLEKVEEHWKPWLERWGYGRPA